MLCYCKKCGRVVSIDQNDDNICDYCQNVVIPVPENFLVSEKVPILKSDLEEQFINEYIKSSSEFDQYLFDHRDEDLHNRRMENKAKLEHGKAILEESSRQVKCTYCGSTNVKKIGLLNRAVSTELWGLGSKKIGKQFHCNNCGADF